MPPKRNRPAAPARTKGADKRKDGTRLARTPTTDATERAILDLHKQLQTERAVPNNELDALAHLAALDRRIRRQRHHKTARKSTSTDLVLDGRERTEAEITLSDARNARRELSRELANYEAAKQAGQTAEQLARREKAIQRLADRANLAGSPGRNVNAPRASGPQEAADSHPG